MLLNTHSYFSLKYGILSPEKLLQCCAPAPSKTADVKPLRAIALTDINTTSGILDFFRLAPRYHIKPVAGIDFRNGNQACYVGLAKNAEGFNELNIFLTHHLQNKIPFPLRAPKMENACFVYPFARLHALPAQLNNKQEMADWLALCENLAPHEYIGVGPKDFFKLQQSPLRFHLHRLLVLAPATFTNKGDFNTHRLLRAIDNNCLLSKVEREEQAAADEIFYTDEALRVLYRDYPHLLRNTERLLDECHIDFEFHCNKNRKLYTASAQQDHELLLHLCQENLHYRYPNPGKEFSERFKKEIEAITGQGYTSYFLINWDIVRYAQSKNYYYVGRGSGANSLVAYLLRITDVDPIDLDLYFERFINASRTSPPDFDIDFSWNDRDDVTDYIFNRSCFGRDRVALLATYSTFQKDSVLRELGKVFGLPPAEIDALQDRLFEPKQADSIAKLILQYSERIHDMPNHLSVHAGGILISEKPMTYYTALENPPKGFPLTQFSMLEAEDVGLYKFDILSQRGLGKMKDAVALVAQNREVKVDLHQVAAFKQDAAIRENLRNANLIGCFYVESPAMRMLLRKLKASTYLDLVAASSIIRPGVAQSGMMREYILRFHDENRRAYIHPMMKELMAETFGVMVYQEDVIKVAHHFAQLTLTEADMLRRGMSGKYRGRDEFKKVEEKFFTNCKNIGYPDDITREVWRQIESFAGYAFSKGHSASYAVESYQCMYLKTYFPLEYMVAVINNGGGFYSTEFYVHEARMCGASIHAPDVNKSIYASTIYGNDIYLGFNLVHELETQTAEALLQERAKGGVYASLENFMARVSISVEQLRLLIRCNAFRFTGRTKQQLLWDVHAQIGAHKKTRIEQEIFEVERKQFALPPLFYSSIDDAWDEIDSLGFALCSPFDLLQLKQRSFTLPPFPAPVVLQLARELPEHKGKLVCIEAYLVTRKRTRTKRGEEMAFGTFLDREGQWVDTTHFPQELKQFPFTGKACYLLCGKVVEEFGFYSLDIVKMQQLDFIPRYAPATQSMAASA